MSNCNCATGGDCTKTTVCQCELTADKLAEALEALVTVLVSGKPSFYAIGDAQDALKEYKGNAT